MGLCIISRSMLPALSLTKGTLYVVLQSQQEKLLHERLIYVTHICKVTYVHVCLCSHVHMCILNTQVCMYAHIHEYMHVHVSKKGTTSTNVNRMTYD